MTRYRRLRITIPEGLDFGALRLGREPDGHVSYDGAVRAEDGYPGVD